MGPHGPHGAHGRPRAPSPLVVVRRNFEKFTKIGIFPFFGSKMGQKKLRLRGRDPPSQNRAAILRLGAVSMSKMVARRPIWWQKGVIWGPLGFRAALAHPWAPGPFRFAKLGVGADSNRISEPACPIRNCVPL